MESSADSAFNEGFQFDKLNDQNYRVWKVKVEALDARDLLKIVLGGELWPPILSESVSEAMTNEENTKYDQLVDRWYEKEKQAKALLLFSL
eukprot:c27909_g1_i2 orf=79-351(+)